MAALHELRRSGAASTPAPSFALWSLGFRPFYLAASLFAALSIPLWIAQYAGYPPFAYVRGPAAHAVEMLFGYTLAVIAGFLFTAVRNWTGRPTPTGGTLVAFVLLWLAGRVLAVTPHPLVAALVDAAFPLAVAVGIGIPIVRAGNRRNYFFIALLVVLAAASLVLHLSMLALLPWSELPTLRVVLDLMIFLMAVMGGRVIPMFTNNGVPGANARRLPALEKAALGGVVLLALADAVQAPAVALVPLCAALAVLHAWRLALWQPWRTWRTPLVWILHAAYAWIGVYFVLRALAAADLVAEPIAVHALTIGAIGGLTLGMMTRTARGHTARPLVADRADVACYTLVMLAAICRVGGALIWPGGYVVTVVASGVFWACAFVVYTAAYAPFLLRPRLDGKPG